MSYFCKADDEAPLRWCVKERSCRGQRTHRNRLFTCSDAHGKVFACRPRRLDSGRTYLETVPVLEPFIARLDANQSLAGWAARSRFGSCFIMRSISSRPVRKASHQHGRQHEKTKVQPSRVVPGDRLQRHPSVSLGRDQVKSGRAAKANSTTNSTPAIAT